MENYDANIRYDRYNYTANLNLKPTETTTIDNIVVDTSLVTEVSKIITYQKLVFRCLILNNF